MSVLVPSPESGAIEWSDRVARIVELCRGRRVLHLGCGDAPLTEAKISSGKLLHAKLCEVAAQCFGVDSSATAIEILRSNGFDEVMAGRIEDVGCSRQICDRRFDIILAAEILEHVSNAGNFLISMATLLRENAGARLIVTIPNAYCAYRFLYMALTGRERGNPDHVAHYSPKALASLLARNGFKLEDLSFYSGKEYLRNQGRERILYWFDRLVYRWRPQFGSGLIAVCRLALDSVESESEYAPSSVGSESNPFRQKQHI